MLLFKQGLKYCAKVLCFQAAFVLPGSVAWSVTVLQTFLSPSVVKAPTSYLRRGSKTHLPTDKLSPGFSRVIIASFFCNNFLRTLMTWSCLQ